MPETIGLDIGSHSIKLVGLKMTSKGPFLTHAGIKEIPYGGNKEDVNPVVEILRTLLDEVGIKSKKVNLAVSGSGVHITRTTLPSMPKAELKEAVRWEIKGKLPFPVETAQIDFHILDEFVEDGVKKLDLMVVACPNHLIDQTLSIVEGAGLQPLRLDVGPNALWNALLSWDRFKTEETVALIDLGAEKTGIHFFKDGTLQFSREVTPAGADMTRAIMEEIGPERDSALLFERAEKIKQEIGVPSETQPKGMVDKSINVSKISFLIRPVLERMAAEIGRSFDYYRSQFSVERIDRILLTGGGANLKNIIFYLASELRCPVENFNPLSKILFDSKKIDVQFLEQMGSLFTIAKGMAFPGPKRIELLPTGEPFWSKARIEKLVPFLAPVVTLLIFLFIIWYMNGQMASVKKEWEAKTAKVTNLETLRAKLKVLKEKEEKIKQELSLFPASMIVSVPYREVLREVSQVVPDNVTLTLLSVQNKGKPLRKGAQPSKPPEGESPKDGGKELYITGVVFGSDGRCLRALAQIIERLERSPLFKNVKLVSADENKLYNQPGAEFEIVCDINLNGQMREP
jgi:type IV pilus assembly protein PilM